MKDRLKRKRKLHRTKKCAFLESSRLSSLTHLPALYIFVEIVDLNQLQVRIDKPYRLAARRQILLHFLGGVLSEIAWGDNFDGQRRRSFHRRAIQVYLLKVFGGNKRYIWIPDGVRGQAEIHLSYYQTEMMSFHELNQSYSDALPDYVMSQGRRWFHR